MGLGSLCVVSLIRLARSLSAISTIHLAYNGILICMLTVQPFRPSFSTRLRYLTQHAEV